MFTAELITFLKERVAQLTKFVEHSHTNHHSIVGRLQEAQELVKLAEKGAESVAAAVEEAVPVVEEVAKEVEGVVV